MSSIYDGQRLAGTVERSGGGFTAFDVDGKALGVFATQLDAVRAVLAPHAPVSTPERGAPDAEIELLAAINAMARSR